MNDAAMLADGYRPCVCGEWVIGMHVVCRTHLTQERYDAWVISSARLSMRRMSA